jgi:hypothetical protein
LYLTEITTGTDDRCVVASLIEQLNPAVIAAGGRVVEVQVSQDLARIFLVAEDVEPASLSAALADIGESQSEPAAVRLVGARLDDERAPGDGTASHLVEWDFPAGLDMDTYLARKKEKAPLYAQVPEVSFLRTYVREDMGKCLCLYDAPDDAAVVRAREVVSTPIDRLHRLAATFDIVAPFYQP